MALHSSWIDSLNLIKWGGGEGDAKRSYCEDLWKVLANIFCLKLKKKNSFNLSVKKEIKKIILEYKMSKNEVNFMIKNEKQQQILLMFNKYLFSINKNQF